MKECERSNYGTSGVVKKTLWKFGRGVSNLVEFCFNIWLIWNKHTGKIRVTNSHTVVRKKGISLAEKSWQKNIRNAKGNLLRVQFVGQCAWQGTGWWSDDGLSTRHCIVTIWIPKYVELKYGFLLRINNYFTKCLCLMDTASKNYDV